MQSNPILQAFKIAAFGILAFLVWISFWQTSRQEAWFLKTLRDALAEDEQIGEVLERFEHRLDVSEDEVLEKLAALPDTERGEVLEACYLAAVLDGKVHKRELEVIRRIADACGVEIDEDRIQALKGELS